MFRMGGARWAVEGNRDAKRFWITARNMQDLEDDRCTYESVPSLGEEFLPGPKLLGPLIPGGTPLAERCGAIPGVSPRQFFAHARGLEMGRAPGLRGGCRTG